MSKKVLVISTSLRKNSNSEALADAFAEGAMAAGHQVEKLSLCGKEIGFCKGCLRCQSTGRCGIRDDVAEIVEKMGRADVIAFATPIYYYEMSGQMKTLLDRSNTLFDKDYDFRDIYLLTAAAEVEDDVPEGAAHGLKGWIACFEKANFAGQVFAGGVTDPGEIRGHSGLDSARSMGKNI